MRPRSATAATRGSGFGARLREARERAGWSQTQLADAIGKRKDSVSQWEREVMGVSWDTLRQIAEVLEADEYWLRDGKALPVYPGTEAAADFSVIRDGVSQVVEQIDRLQKRADRLETVLLALADELARGDKDTASQFVEASRRWKALLVEDLDAEVDVPATEAETSTRGADDATPGSAQAPSAGTRRSASKRAR